MKTVKLGDICDLMTGGTPSKSQKEYFEGGSIRWLVSGDIHKSEIFDCDGRITELGLRNSNARLLPVNSIMIALNGQGKTRATAAILRVEATCNQSLVSIYPKDDSKVLPEWIYWNLKGRYEELRKVTGDSGNDRRGLNMIILRNIDIPEPPCIIEQKEIVEKLDGVFEKIDRAIELTKKNIQNTHILFDAIVEQEFSSSIDWEATKLGDVYDVRDGTHDSPKYHAEGYPLVTSKNLKNHTLDLSKVNLISKEDYESINRRSGVDVGDVLFAMIGTIGSPVVVETKAEFAIKNVALFKQKGSNNPYFLKYYLDSRLVIEKMLNEAKGSTQKFVGLGYLRSFPIKLPNLDMQNDIVLKLDNALASTQTLLVKYQTKLEKLKALKQSMLEEAFRGGSGV